MKIVLPVLLLVVSSSVFADEKINWNGVYGSAMIGRHWGDIGGDDGTWTYVPDEQYRFSGDSSSLRGWSGNVKLGYNKQLDNNLLGIELGGTWQTRSANAVAITSYDGAPDSTPYSVMSKTKVRTYETLAARIGHIFNNTTLVYVSGGAALGQIKSTLYATSDASDAWLTDGGSAGSVSDKKTELGYTLGFGIEHKLNEKLALRANYEYVDFGKVDFDYYNSIPGYQANISLSNSIHFSNLSAGVSYAF